MNRVKYTTTTTGTGALTVSTVTGFQDLAAVRFNQQSTNNKFYYVIVDADGTAWEHGFGSISGSTFSRDYILESTNSDAAISLSAGTHTVYVTRAGLEGTTVQHVLGVTTPVAVTGGAHKTAISITSEAVDGLGAAPSSTSISGDLPLTSLSAPLSLIPYAKSYRAILYAMITPTATDGMAGVHLWGDYDIAQFDTWVPLINTKQVSAVVSTPWMNMPKLDGTAGGISSNLLYDYGTLNWGISNSGSTSFTPSFIELVLEWYL